jgi:hypothetical protein
METDITLIATGYALARIGIIAAVAYLFYRYMLSSRTARVPIRCRSNYARERYESSRSNR